MTTNKYIWIDISYDWYNMVNMYDVKERINILSYIAIIIYYVRQHFNLFNIFKQIGRCI